MTLDERKLQILRAIIDDYIETAEPIGSRTIARKLEIGLSPATIRNEMADLEEMGYLEQPHTSAGRVPSVKGYRYYVDRLMAPSEISMMEIEQIRQAMDVKIYELSQLVRQASSILSRVTNYTSVAVTPQFRKDLMKAVQVVPLEPGRVLIVVVMQAGVVKNHVARVPDWTPPEYLVRLSQLINEHLTGLAVNDVNLQMIMKLQREAGVPREILMPILEGVSDCVAQMEQTELVLDGASNIFRYPEYRDVSRAREFMDILNDKEQLTELLLQDGDDGKILVRIGTENSMQDMSDCTLITTSYSMGDRLIGSIGILGPKRMEYGRVISAMNHLRSCMHDEMRKLAGEDAAGRGP